MVLRKERKEKEAIIALQSRSHVLYDIYTYESGISEFPNLNCTRACSLQLLTTQQTLLWSRHLCVCVCVCVYVCVCTTDFAVVTPQQTLLWSRQRQFSARSSSKMETRSSFTDLRFLQSLLDHAIFGPAPVVQSDWAPLAPLQLTLNNPLPPPSSALDLSLFCF